MTTTPGYWLMVFNESARLQTEAKREGRRLDGDTAHELARNNVDANLGQPVLEFTEGVLPPGVQPEIIRNPSTGS